MKPDPKHFNEWLALRSRLYAQERAFERARAAKGSGEAATDQELSIQYSEIRALRALSRALIRRNFLDEESAADEKPQRGSK